MATSQAAPPNILLVDDCRDGLLVRRALLEELGCSVEMASSGEEALKLFEAEVFDIVVTDYRMPRMNGTELIQRIRKLEPRARIILLSGFVETMGLTEESTGADAIVVKSSNEPARLTRIIRRLANRPPVRKPPASQKRSMVKARTGTP